MENAAAGNISNNIDPVSPLLQVIEALNLPLAPNNKPWSVPLPLDEIVTKYYVFARNVVGETGNCTTISRVAVP